MHFDAKLEAILVISRNGTSDEVDRNRNKRVNAVRMNSVSYPNILQFAGKLTDFMLFLLPRFSLCTHLAIAHNNFKHNVPQNTDRLAE